MMVFDPLPARFGDQQAYIPPTYVDQSTGNMMVHLPIKLPSIGGGTVTSAGPLGHAAPLQNLGG